MQILIRHITHHLDRRERALHVEHNHILIATCRCHNRVYRTFEQALQFLYTCSTANAPHLCIGIGTLNLKKRITAQHITSKAGLRAIKRKPAHIIEPYEIKESIDRTVGNGMGQRHYRIITAESIDIELS